MAIADATSLPLEIETNTGATLQFRSLELLQIFANVTSTRVASGLDVLLRGDDVSDGLFHDTLSALRDLAFETQEAIALMARAHVSHAETSHG